ncbi:uncharacterized protein LOC102375464 isoform X2 [Alligator sinensis]|uniref:Uncharacterized protein LOC102375464 isoform X2 n=1 Tax=Alligator sinensis TaxID=38654 RepID=A0A3Q0GUM1_ALLSI|nr:uncharacterized protein LOC102375464 isoform X2 [Alligator sinensis]
MHQWQHQGRLQPRLFPARRAEPAVPEEPRQCHVGGPARGGAADPSLRGGRGGGEEERGADAAALRGAGLAPPASHEDPQDAGGRGADDGRHAPGHRGVHAGRSPVLCRGRLRRHPLRLPAALRQAGGVRGAGPAPGGLPGPGRQPGRPGTAEAEAAGSRRALAGVDEAGLRERPSRPAAHGPQRPGAGPGDCAGSPRGGGAGWHLRTLRQHLRLQRHAGDPGCGPGNHRRHAGVHGHAPGGRRDVPRVQHRVHPVLQSPCGRHGQAHRGPPRELHLLRLVGMTQEHGRVEPVVGALDFSEFPLGSLLALIPYHACATAAMHPVYYIHAEGKVVATWKPVRGW